MSQQQQQESDMVAEVNLTGEGITDAIAEMLEQKNQPPILPYGNYALEATLEPDIEEGDTSLSPADIAPQEQPQGQIETPNANERTLPPVTEASEVAAPTQQKDDPSFVDYLVDMTKGIANAPINAVNETINFVGTALNGGKEFDIVKEAGKVGIDFGNFGKTETGAGKFVEDVGTFLAGFYTGGKILKGLSLLQGAGKASTVANGMTRSFYSTVTGFDGHEKMLSNMVQEYPELQNIITESLAVSKDDSELVGRLKCSSSDKI
jgi:hypothetical protein